MFEFLLAVALSLTTHTQIPQNTLTKDIDRGHIIPVDYQETTSFSNAITLALNDANGIALFHSSSDTDYYKYPITQSGYYKFSVDATTRVKTEIYTTSLSNPTPTYYTEYDEQYTDNNFGFDNGIYINASSINYLYFKIRQISGNSNEYYIPVISNFVSHNSNTFELLRYDVDEKLFHYKLFTYIDDNTTQTVGYNPNGSTNFNLPYGVTGSISNFMTNGLSTLSYPYCCAGNLKYYTGNSYVSGTSYLVGGNILVTAAHCFYDRTNKKLKNEINSNYNVYLGKNGPLYYVEQTRITTIYISKTYLTIESDPEEQFDTSPWLGYDLALCVVEDNYFDTLGYLPFINVSRITNNLNDNEQYLIYGYRGDQGDYGEYPSLSYVELRDNNTNNIRFQNGCINYTNNSSGGNSGGPLLDNSRNIVMGTHVASGAGASLFNDSMYFATKELISGGNI